MYKNKNILIVGAGIHGCFLAKYLSDYDLNIHVIEKNKDICLGSSNATHNRANRGFHYPRSAETTNECKTAYKYFERNYNKLPIDWLIKKESDIKQRIICDYISGMTDRYASKLYKSVYD